MRKVTAVTAITNNVLLAPESWKAKNTHISSTRNGTRLIISVQAIKTARTGAKGMICGNRKVAMTKPMT